METTDQILLWKHSLKYISTLHHPEPLCGAQETLQPKNIISSTTLATTNPSPSSGVKKKPETWHLGWLVSSPYLPPQFLLVLKSCSRKNHCSGTSPVLLTVWSHYSSSLLLFPTQPTTVQGSQDKPFPCMKYRAIMNCDFRGRKWFPAQMHKTMHLARNNIYKYKVLNHKMKE